MLFFLSLEMPYERFLAIDNVGSARQFRRVIPYMLSRKVEDTFLQASCPQGWDRPYGSGFSAIVEIAGEPDWCDIPTLV